jgi:hypothetical protein
MLVPGGEGPEVWMDFLDFVFKSLTFRVYKWSFR